MDYSPSYKIKMEYDRKRESTVGSWCVELIKEGLSHEAIQMAKNYMIANDVKMDKTTLHVIAVEFQKEFLS